MLHMFVLKARTEKDKSNSYLKKNFYKRIGDQKGVKRD